MFASSTRRIVTLIAASLTAASLSLALVPAAQAGGFSFEVDLSGPLMIHSPHDNIDYQADFGFNQRFFDRQWDMLQREDNGLHVQIKTPQHDHDCLAVKKIKALLAEMKANLKHYIAIHAEQWIIDSEIEDIATWTERLREAQKACD